MADTRTKRRRMVDNLVNLTYNVENARKVNFAMVEITDEEYELFQKLKTILKHSKAEKLEGVYFICGESGEKDDVGLPEYISVCPAYGSDGIAMYKKHKDYSAPGW